MTQRELFLKHVAQTSVTPLALEIVRAEGAVLFDQNGKEYIDLIGGIAVANIGHRNQKVITAIQKQMESYLHIMVYGEFVQSPQVQFAKKLTDHLPPALDSVYFTNSGAEAVEGAMKLAKRATNRSQIISFHNSYHGSTQGALSLIGSEYWRNAFRPLLPGILHLGYNSMSAIDEINTGTACVVAETIQGEAGIKAPSPEWMKALRKKCTDTGALLILDEIQTAFGRTGRLWAFEEFEIIPNILLLGKALGGGMPLGAFIANRDLMQTLVTDPILGHITTFGGHPVCCAAGLAGLEALLEENMMEDVSRKKAMFTSMLVHPMIKEIRSAGLWIAVDFDSFEINKKVIDYCIEKGVLTDWFLFNANSLRISPPLIITDEQIKRSCSIILEACSEAGK